jgi:polyferredoxin
MIERRRIVQAASLALFVLWVAWPAHMVAGELLFRLDPIASGVAALAGRTVLWSLALVVILLVVTLLRGRVFCGWVCPFGTGLDLADVVVAGKTRWPRARHVKRCAALFLAAAAAVGLAIGYLLDPLAWASRLAGFFATGRASLLLFAATAAVLAALHVAFGRRAFCRVLCPLGALLGWIADLSPHGRSVSQACTGCGECTAICPVAASGETPAAHDRKECIRCKACAGSCPSHALSFGAVQVAAEARPDARRRSYLLALGASALAGVAAGLLAPRARGRRVVRPPGAVAEQRFVDLCVRCGACVRACPTGGLVPAGMELGLTAFETPVLDGRRGGCAFDCRACGQVCVTGAIRALPLEVKQREVVGRAEITEKRCNAYQAKAPCVLCFVACPVQAIAHRRADAVFKKSGTGIYLPRVVGKKCTGCGLCEHRCPVEGEAAIRVAPVDPSA